MFGVQLLEPSGLLVQVQRLAVQVGGLSMDLAQARMGPVSYQALAAFGGDALAAGPLTRPIAELPCALSPLAMLLGTLSRHDLTVPRSSDDVRRRRSGPPPDVGFRTRLVAARAACRGGDGGRCHLTAFARMSSIDGLTPEEQRTADLVDALKSTGNLPRSSRCSAMERPGPSKRAMRCNSSSNSTSNSWFK